MTGSSPGPCAGCGRPVPAAESPGSDRLVSGGAGLAVALVLGGAIWGLTRSAEITLVYPVVLGLATASLVANDRALARLRARRCPDCTAAESAPVSPTRQPPT